MCAKDASCGTFLAPSLKLQNISPFHCTGGGKSAASTLDLTLLDDHNGTSFSFCRDDWIGKGVDWSSNLPAEVRQACERELLVPEHILSALIPNCLLSVAELLCNPLLPATSCVNATFSNNLPNVFIGTFANTEITEHRAALFEAITSRDALSMSFRNAWLSGGASVCLGNPTYYYPLWIVRLLADIYQYSERHQKWDDVSKWLYNLAHTPPAEAPVHLADMIEDCRERLTTIPYIGTVSGFSKSIHLSIRHLASFLSTDWLDDEMLNASAEYIMKRIGPGKKRTRIVNCLHLQFLQHAKAEGRSAYTPTTRFDNLIQSKQLDMLYLPLHVFGDHWTLLRVDLRKGIYSYADCLNHENTTPPTKILNLIRWWLESLLPNIPPLTSIPFEFSLPQQRDAHSCGIIVLNLMAFILLHYGIWSPSIADAERMEWFLRLSDDYNDIVVHELSDDDHQEDNCNLDSSPQPVPYHQDDSSDMDLDGVDLPSRLMTKSVASSTPINLGKRKHALISNLSESTLSMDSESESDGDSDSYAARANNRNRRGPKIGSSWETQKKLRDLAQKSKFTPSDRRLAIFREKILKDDPHAEFQDTNILKVRCSSCAEWLHMRVVYDIQKWNTHRETTKCSKNRASGFTTRSLFTLGFGYSAIKVGPQRYSGTRPFPCPGLSCEDPRIDKYLSRTSTSGGGAPSRSVIVKELFNGDDIGWKDLSTQQQRMVLRREEVLQLWKISRATCAVYSARCESTVHSSVTMGPQPCSECISLFKLRKFQVVINRPMPAEANMKYVPKSYRSAELGDLYLKYSGVRQLVEKDNGKSPWLRFAQGVLDGVYKSDTLLGMIEAMVVKSERLRKGKSLRNMKYTEAFTNFCNVLASTSTRGYLTFKRHFGGRGMTNIRKLRAQMPRFQPGISAHNLEVAAAVLKRYGYTGPLALSWDDTDLEKAISVFQESKDVCAVIGSIDGIIRVTSNDDIDSVLEHARLHPASKLRVWLLTIPLPKIPPILIAAVARGPSEDAYALYNMHSKLAELMDAQGIHPVSGSSDGTEVERSTQHLISNSSQSYHIYSIPNTILSEKCQIVLRIPLYKGRYPFVAVQDSKHALKTSRNQVFTGARILVLGHFPAHFSQLREVAANPASPLFHRDVEKVDRQDDRAAARMFSATTLDFQMKTYPDQQGLSVYLFVLGELVDGWQNRCISHLERAKMVIRARFFLMAWRSFVVAHPDYSVNIQFISRESYDIFLTLCDSLLSLIIIYRQFYVHYPLLPWLHSTEPCEHVFGVMRQIKKDFTFADILAAEPKLRTLLLGAFGDLTPEEQSNQTASGYHHTYFKTDDLDLAELMCYPTDAELAAASDSAFREAESLLSVIGISATRMLNAYTEPVQLSKKKATSPPSEGPQTLAQLFALFDQSVFSTSKAEDKSEAVELALVAENIDRSLAIHDIPDSTEESFDAVTAAIEENLNVLPSMPINKQTDPTAILHFKNSKHQLDRKVIVSQRERHQTRSTAKAVRQNGRLALPMNDKTLERFVNKGPTLREALTLQLLTLTPRPADTPTSTAGINRQVRHMGTFINFASESVGCKEDDTRARNKATVLASASVKFLRHREQAFENLRGVHENFPYANILPHNPLMPGNFVIALRVSRGKNPGKQEVILGEVITMYIKSETKNARHEWASSTDSLGKLSYVYIRLFVPLFGENTFTSMACPSLSGSTLLQVPRSHILFSLASYTNIASQSLNSSDGHPLTLLTLCPLSTALFHLFRIRTPSLYTAVRELETKLKAKIIDVDADTQEAECDNNVEECEDLGCEDDD